MSNYKTLFEYEANWKATKVIIDRPYGEVQTTLTVTLSNGAEVQTLEFLHPDDPENIIELMDFERLVVSEEVGAERDFGIIKVEFLGEVYAELWCDAVSHK